MDLETTLQRLGRLDLACPRSFWICADSPEEVGAADSLIDGLRRDYPRVRLVFASADHKTREWLARRYPDDAVAPLPYDLGIAVRAHMERLKPRLLLILGTGEGIGRRLLRRLDWWQIPVVWIQPGGVAGGSLDRRLVPFVQRFFVSEHAEREALARMGISSGQVTMPAGATAILQDLSVLIRQDLKIKRSEGRPLRSALEALLLRTLARPAGRRLLAPWAERIDDLDTLAAALGRPGVIMCLGNGPSSEDPALREMAHDCLFRVNHMWLDRGILSDADMVFTGDKKALRRIPGAVFGFQTARAEGRLLRAHLLSGRVRTLRYVVMERLGILFDGTDWGARPTNGMAMIALAVALKPRRIILGGMDLFAHPAGGYPGEVDTANAYTPLHDKDVELRIIKHYLGRYDGDVVIVGDVLRQSLGLDKGPEPSLGLGASR